MLQNYDDCNKIVTNGKSGAKNAIVKSGDQIIHAFAAGEEHAVTGAGVCARNGYVSAGQAGKLEAGISW